MNTSNIINIQGLKDWLQAEGINPEAHHVYIGKNVNYRRCFGLYRDGSNFVLYKNKADGTRAIRYSGPDEAYCVRELIPKINELVKLKQDYEMKEAQKGRVEKRANQIQQHTNQIQRTGNSEMTQYIQWLRKERAELDIKTKVSLEKGTALKDTQVKRKSNTNYGNTSDGVFIGALVIILTVIISLGVILTFTGIHYDSVGATNTDRVVSADYSTHKTGSDFWFWWWLFGNTNSSMNNGYASSNRNSYSGSNSSYSDDNNSSNSSYSDDSDSSWDYNNWGNNSWSGGYNWNSDWWGNSSSWDSWGSSSSSSQSSDSWSSSYNWDSDW